MTTKNGSPAAGKIANRDLEMYIEVRVNPVHETPQAGASSAYRWDTTGEINQGHALILFGKWARNAEGRLQPQRRPNTGLTAAHAIAVSVVADPKRLAATVAAIGFKGIAAPVAN